MSQSSSPRYGRSAQEVRELTVDVNRLEGSISVNATTSGRGCAVLSLFLSDVGGPVLFHHRADDDVEHRVLDVLLDESTESGVIVLRRVDGRLVLVDFTVRQDLWAIDTRTRARVYQEREKKNPDVRSQKSTRAPKKQKQQRIIWVTLTGSSSRMCDGWG